MSLMIRLLLLRPGAVPSAVAAVAAVAYVPVLLVSFCCCLFVAAAFVAAGRIRLSLYGHKLPVTTVSVSSSGLLLASGSVDKSLKVWGLDFGDVRKSFRAHDEALTKVRV